MVEIEVYCVGGDHIFKLTFADPVDWESVKRTLKSEELQCEEHRMSFWMDE